MALRTLRAEWTAGKKLADETERNAAIILDATTTQYLNRIEEALVRNAGLSGCFTVKVINDDEPNAQSLPGGFLYITSGLILMANNESELAAALAHETAHVSARHFTRINQSRRLWRRLALIGGPAGYLARRSFGPLLFLKLVRDSEFEADRLGLEYLRASGYDPEAIERLLRSLVQNEDSPGPFFERLFDSHPLTTTRMKRLDEMAHNFVPAHAGYLVDTDEFENVRARILLLTLVPIPDEYDRLTPVSK
jgi:predicted Zn-dependent protease